MNKQRAINLYVKTLIAEDGGAGDLGLMSEHIYYELCKILKDNEWEAEAKRVLKEKRAKLRDSLNPIIEEYKAYIKGTPISERPLKEIKKDIQKVDVSGEIEEVAKYEALNKETPPKEYLEKILSERHAKDKQYIEMFQENMIGLITLRDVDMKNLRESIEYLEDNGLLIAQIKRVPENIVKSKIKAIYK